MKKLTNILPVTLFMAGCTHLSDVQHRQTDPVEQNGETSEAIEKIEYFFDDFIALLTKYESADTRKEIRIKEDLETLREEYTEQCEVPLSRKYTWDDDKYTPLLFTARQGNLQVMKILCSDRYKAESDITAKTEIRELTALHLAAAGGHQKLVEYLVESKNMAVELGDKSRFLPIHYATYTGNKALVQYLADRTQPDLYTQNEKGWSPLHIAIICGFEDLVGILSEKTTSEVIANAKLNDKTALQHAEEIRDPQKKARIMELLRKKLNCFSSMKRNGSSEILGELDNSQNQPKKKAKLIRGIEQ